MSIELLAIIINATVVIIGYYANSSVTKHRIEQLEKKVEKHNNVVERTYVTEEKIKVINHRLADIERGR